MGDFLKLISLKDMLGLTDSEALALNQVNIVSTVSMKAHTKGVELKKLDVAGSQIANSDSYRSALAKLHKAERSQIPVDY